MGISIDSGGSGGKKPVNADLNLVPFIDLLVCCICFLLITAVWAQMSRIEVNQNGPGKAGEPTEEQLKEMQVKITVLIGDEGYTLTAGGERFVIPKRGESYDSGKLGEELRDLKSRYEDKDDLTLAVEDGISYEHIVTAMDIALQQYFANIRLADAAAASI